MTFDWNDLVIGPTVAIFGDTVLYAPAYGTPYQITGVFDEAYVELTPLGRGGLDTESFGMASPGAISAAMPVLGVQLSQFQSNPEQDDTLTVTSGPHIAQQFVVKEVRSDGHGGAKLLLNAI